MIGSVVIIKHRFAFTTTLPQEISCGKIVVNFAKLIGNTKQPLQKEGFSKNISKNYFLEVMKKNFINKLN